MLAKTMRETIKVERVIFKVPVLSCGHKHRPIVANQPVRKHYHCSLCARAEAIKKTLLEKRGPIFSE